MDLKNVNTESLDTNLTNMLATNTPKGKQLVLDNGEPMTVEDLQKYNFAALIAIMADLGLTIPTNVAETAYGYVRELQIKGGGVQA